MANLVMVQTLNFSQYLSLLYYRKYLTRTTPSVKMQRLRETCTLQNLFFATTRIFDVGRSTGFPCKFTALLPGLYPLPAWQVPLQVLRKRKWTGCKGLAGTENCAMTVHVGWSTGLTCIFFELPSGLDPRQELARRFVVTDCYYYQVSLAYVLCNYNTYYNISYSVTFFFYTQIYLNSLCFVAF